MTPASLMRRAERALAGAHLLHAHGNGEGACSRAYYAMFHAAQAALAAAGLDLTDGRTKTHRGLIAAFGQHLVLTDLVDAEFGRALSRAEQRRLSADYLGEVPHTEESARAVGDAAAFLRVIQETFPAVRADGLDGSGRASDPG